MVSNEARAGEFMSGAVIEVGALGHVLGPAAAEQPAERVEQVAAEAVQPDPQAVQVQVDRPASCRASASG